MNKHILSYTDRLNESIGRGSVLLIKGRPLRDGRFLYVTTIKGYVEIKPGIKMVFIDDTIYRVIHKGENKFSGRKVDYKGEDGLKGVFNMRNPGKPSIVLNHNKTPFHWITLNYLDIGKSLREIGPRLFNHELILESYDKESDVNIEAKNFIVREVAKLITQQDTILKLIDIDIIEGGEDLDSMDDAEGGIHEHKSEFELSLHSEVDLIPAEYHKYLSEEGLFPMTYQLGDFNKGDLDILGLSDSLPGDETGLKVSILYETDADIINIYDGGDYETPPFSSTEVNSVESRLSEFRDSDQFTIAGDYASVPDDVKSDLNTYNKMIASKEPIEILEDLKRLSEGYGKVKVSSDKD